MCGSRAGWKTYCTINHVPFFSATHWTRSLSQTEAKYELSWVKMQRWHIPPNRYKALSDCSYSDNLISFKWCSPYFLVPWLTLRWQYLNIHREECVPRSNEASFSPVLCQQIKWKDRGRRRRKMSVFINVLLMYSGIPVFQVFVSEQQKDQRMERHAHSSSAGEKAFLFLFALLCATHNLATAPVVAPGQCICPPFVLQKALTFEQGPSMNGGNTYSFFSSAKSSCSPSASIRSFSDAGWLWRGSRQGRGWERLVTDSGRHYFWLMEDGSLVANMVQINEMCGKTVLKKLE